MLIKVNQQIELPFSTRDPSTGNAANATSTEASVFLGDLFVPGTDIAVVQADGRVGQYVVRLTCDPAQGFAAGNIYNIRVKAEVNGVTDEAPIATFEMSEEKHGLVIDKSIASVETNIVNAGNNSWTTATDINSVGTVTNPVTVGTNNDKFGYRLDATGIQGVWDYVEVSGISGGKNAFEVICMSAAGAGAGTVDVGVAPGTTRDETFRYLNDTDAFVVTADEEGNRTAVNLNPP